VGQSNRVGKGALRAVPTIFVGQASLVGTLSLCPIYHLLAMRLTISMRPAHQRAATLVERPERLIARDGGDELVEIPFAL